MPALELKNVSFSFPATRRQRARHAVQQVSLTIDAGQSVALLGPNGSGKSTLMRMICGQLAPSEGAIRIFAHSAERARNRLGVVFQNPGLDRHMTVMENLRDSAALYGLTGAATRERIHAMLAEFSLADRSNDLVKTLSGGLARRVDLCRALLSQPDLLILDEPTAGLDIIARSEFLNLLPLRRETGPQPTTLMSTHLIDEAERMDRVLMMHNGRIVADGSPTELRRSVGTFRLEVIDRDWQPGEEREQWSHSPNGWLRRWTTAEPPVEAIESLTRSGVAFSFAPPTLADAFEILTGDRLEQPENTEASQ